MIVVLQRDIKDCGPCALQSIVQYYGGYVSLEKIREHAYTDQNGTTVYHLMKAANRYGLDAIAKKYLDNQIESIKLSAIVHVHYENGLNHYMCLYKISKDTFTLMDPAKGKIVLKKKDFLKIFTGIGIEFSLRSQIVLLEKESNIYMLFLNIIKKNKKLCMQLMLSSVLLTIFTIVSGLHFKICYEYVQNNSFINTIKYLIYLFLIAFILKCIFGFTKKYYEAHINKNIDVCVFSNFINHIFRLPLKVINTKAVGEIISRVNEIGSIKEIFSQLFISAFLELFLSVSAFIMLFFIDKTLAGVLVLIMIFYILFSILLNPYIYKRIRQNIDYQTEFNSVLIDRLSIINSIKNLNQVNNSLDTIEKYLSQIIYDDFDFTNVINCFEFFKNLLYELGILGINTLGFYFIYQNKINLVDLVVFNTLIGYFTSPLQNIVGLIPKFNFLRASFNKICDFIDLEEEKEGTLSNFILGDIVFNNVSFSYNEYSNVLQDFNLTIKKGEKIMLKGYSGNGKSTLCKLLLRFYDPGFGAIYINDKNILDYNLITLRKNIIYVSQKEGLVSDTIKNNILCYSEEDEKFEKVCKICLIDEIVNKKAFRYDFGIDNSFTNISGGEKQRIVLARALLKCGKIIVLDEALSEVDFFMERKIIKNLNKAFPDKTIIYITHKKQDDLFDRVINIGGKFD